MDKLGSLLAEGGISLDRLRNFCLIAEAGGITKAAEGDLGKQSLYSRQIKELKTFFGIELKRRQGKGIALTDAGRQLAQLVRVHLAGLEDFRRTARALPKRLSIAAGNSVLEWLVLPRIGALRERLPDSVFEFRSQRTATIVSDLMDMTCDVGIIRETAVKPPLKSRRLVNLGYEGYSLFLPARFADGVTQENLKQRIAAIPIVTSMGGQFRENLETEAAKAGWPLRISVSCSSFTQAARTARSGGCGAILPGIARADFDGAQVREFALPFLKRYTRQLCIAWNPRLLDVRSSLPAAVSDLYEILRETSPSVSAPAQSPHSLARSAPGMKDNDRCSASSKWRPK
jgi:DNA-binding transcriptional LysR family regulator